MLYIQTFKERKLKKIILKNQLFAAILQMHKISVITYIFLTFLLFFVTFIEPFKHKFKNGLLTSKRKDIELNLLNQGLGGVVDIVYLMNDNDFYNFSNLFHSWQDGNEGKIRVLKFLKEWIKQESYGLDGSFDCLKDENRHNMSNECNNVFKIALEHSTQFIFYRRYIEKNIFENFQNDGNNLHETLLSFYDNLHVTQKGLFEDVISVFYEPPISYLCSPYDRNTYVLDNDNVMKSICEIRDKNFHKDIGKDDVAEIILMNQLYKVIPNEDVFLLEHKNLRESRFKAAFEKLQQLSSIMSTIPFFKRWKKILSKKFYSYDFIDSVSSYVYSLINNILSDETKNLMMADESINYNLLHSTFTFFVKSGEFISKKKNYSFKRTFEKILSKLKNGLTISNLGLNIGKFVYESSVSNGLNLLKSIENFFLIPLSYCLNKEYKIINEAMVSSDEDEKYENAKSIINESKKTKILLAFKSSFMMLGGVTTLTHSILALLAATSPWMLAVIPLAIVTTIITSLGIKKVLAKYRDIDYLEKAWSVSKIYSLPPALQGHENEISEFKIRFTWVFIAHLNISIFNFINYVKKEFIDGNKTLSNLHFLFADLESFTSKIVKRYSEGRKKKVVLHLDELKEKYKKNILDFLVGESSIVGFIAYMRNNKKSSKDVMNSFFGDVWKESNSMEAFNSMTGLGSLAKTFNKQMVDAVEHGTYDNASFLYNDKNLKEKLAAELQKNEVILDLLVASVFDWKMSQTWSFWFGYKKDNTYLTSSSWSPKYIPGVLLYCFTVAIMSSKSVEDFSLKFVFLYSYFLFMSLPASFNPMIEYVESLSAVSYIRIFIRNQLMRYYHRGMLHENCVIRNALLEKIIKLDLDLSKNPKLIEIFDNKKKHLSFVGNVLRFLSIKKNKVRELTVEILKINKGISGGVYARATNTAGKSKILLFTEDILKNWKWEFIFSLYSKDETILSFRETVDLRVIKENGQKYVSITVIRNSEKDLKDDYIKVLSKNSKHLNIFLKPCMMDAEKNVLKVKKKCFIEHYSWRVIASNKNAFNLCQAIDEKNLVKLHKINSKDAKPNLMEKDKQLSYSLAEQSKLVTFTDVLIAENIVETVLHKLVHFFKLLNKKKFYAKDKAVLIAGNILCLKEEDDNVSPFLIVEILNINKNKTYKLKFYEENGGDIKNWSLNDLKKYVWMLNFEKYTQLSSSLIKGNEVEFFSKTGLATQNLPGLFYAVIVDIDLGIYTFNYNDFNSKLKITEKKSFSITLDKLKENYRWRNKENFVLNF